MKRLVIITTHPIQYNAPLFKLLSERNYIDLKVIYTWSQSQIGKLYDPGFKKQREWDIPLLEGYEYEFVENTAKDPGSHHFWGVNNPDLISKIIKFKPDGILVYGWSFFSHLKVLWYFKNKIPIFFRGDSTLLDDVKILFLKKSIRKTFLKWVYHHVDKAFYVGQANKQYFLENGLKEHQLIYAPHCIDNNRFMKDHEYYEEQAIIWRQDVGIPDQSIVFLFAGKLEPKKDPLLLIKAFQSLSDDNIRLIMVGNGVLEKEVKEKAKSDARILFIDFQNQSRMPIVYRLGDVFILPSKGPGETWGLAVNEAMACGRPAIVSNACGCEKDLILNSITGYTFPSGDMNELINCMQVLSDKEKINSMREGVIQHIQLFNYSLVAQAIESNI